jgi:hypothetical protein
MMNRDEKHTRSRMIYHGSKLEANSNVGGFYAL